MRALSAGIILFTAMGVGLVRAEDPATLFEIPHLDGITIDGKGDDWGARGFRVGIIGNEDGNVKPASNLDASFCLGWDERGLLLLLNVSQNVHEEAAGEYWTKDSVELFFSPQRGSPDVFQVVFSPGVDPKYPELRWSVHDNRTEALKKINATVTAARTKTPTGYTLEVLLPWEDLAIKPEAGRDVAFQLYVNDSNGGQRYEVLWYPSAGAGDDSMRMQALRLSDKASPPVNTLVSAGYERLHRVNVQVAATSDLLGKTVTVKDGDHKLGNALLAAQDGRAGAKFVLPMPERGKSYGPLFVAIDGQLLKTVDLPNPDAVRAEAFMNADLNFDPSVFSGTAFPDCDFAQPAYVEDLIGPYTIATTFYDADYNLVTTAEKPGRYGAVVEIKAEDGKTYRRLRTLFRTQGDMHWWRNGPSQAIAFPTESGIDPAVTARQKFSAYRFLQSLVGDSFTGDVWTQSFTPAYLSYLYETKPDAPDTTVFDDFMARDRQWWVGLKRKLDGSDQLYPGPFVCPKPLVGKPAPVVHEGTLKEAGMKPGSVEKLDAVLKEWSADTDQPFAVCLVRHGVVVLHKAYGMRDGKPMTVDTRSWMASQTKTMSGSSVMMLVDQGLVSLDDPVTKFLPAFRSTTAPTTPPTIRYLYTHTAGFKSSWWGDNMNDFDDLIAGVYPYLSVGTHFEYNGADLALGSKILEAVTGEALPQFYKHHLFDPLGCTNTTATDSAGSAYSTPMDMARIGQMLLNRGSYGNMQFMRPETFAQMLPQRLTKELGPDTTTEWGIGLIWYKSDGLGKGTFGHGAASGACLRIDPENDMVISITRNAWGSNLDKYQSKFLAAVMDNIEK